MGRSKDPKTGLTDQQTKFVLMLRTDPERIVSKAYLAAYPKCGSVKAAESNGSALIRKHRVRDYLRKMDDKDMAKFDLTMDNINREKASIIFFDPIDLLDEKGVPKPLHEMKPETRKALKRIKVTVKTVTKGNTSVQLVEHDIQWKDNIPVIDQATRQLGGYEKDNDQKSGGMADLIAAVDGNTRGLPPPDEDGE